MLQRSISNSIAVEKAKRQLEREKESLLKSRGKEARKLTQKTEAIVISCYLCAVKRRSVKGETHKEEIEVI